MSEDTNTTDEPKTDAPAPAGQALAVAAKAPPTPFIPVSSDVAIWDSAQLAHMGRVGVVMADSGLMSETFVKDGDTFLDRSAVIARCVMVANLAREVGANPLMFLQACSIISRKLHIEGKAVNAIIRARTGVELRFRFGIWNTDHIVLPDLVKDPTDERFGLPVDPDFFKDAGERLAVRCYDPKDPERHVDGSVGMWKTTRSGSPWSNAGNYRRQLRYRSAPEWARAYEPGAILGIYSDADEDLDGFEGDEPKPRQRRDLKGKLDTAGKGQEPNPADTGFDRDHVAAETGERPADPQDTATDAEFVDTQDDAKPETVKKGHAKAGEAYLLAGDVFNDAGRRMTYKDGARFSTVTKAGAEKLPVYSAHAPEVGTEEVTPEVTTEETTATAPAAEAEEEPKPAQAAPAAETAPTATEEPAATETATVTSGRAFLASLEDMTTWHDIKVALGNMMKTSDWLQADPADQEEVQCAVWAEVERVRADHGDTVDQANDVSAFNLWIATLGTTRDDADALEGTFMTLKRSDVWGKLKAEQHQKVETRVTAKLKRIRG